MTMATKAPSTDCAPTVLVRNVRLVPVGGVPAPDAPVDLRMAGGRIVAVAPTGELRAGPDDADTHDAQGRWAIPGLWDHHVHLAQWADTLGRVDMSGTISPEAVTERIRHHIRQLPPSDLDSVVVGFGHRSATWARQPTVAELDAVSGRHPVALVSGDGHNGWLNSAALALLGAGSPDPGHTGAGHTGAGHTGAGHTGAAPAGGVLTENAWYPVWARLTDLPGPREARQTAYRTAVARAAALGIVGVGDMEFGDGFLDWPARFAAGVRDLRVRVAVYPDRLAAVLAAGLRSGDVLGDTGGLVRMGPLKVISDGSLNTRTAWCDHPYADAPDLPDLADPCGVANVSAGELLELTRQATDGGLRMAIHAIGDAAVAQALDVFGAAGATGTIEHAQLMRRPDIVRMAHLGVGASVQPAHLLDDRDVTARCWPDRADRCFPLRSMLQAGVAVLLGSDAPVSPLDPWLAMAAAVHRSADERAPWNAGEALTVAQALAASTDGQTTLRVGSRADLVLLDADPLASAETGSGGSRVDAAGPEGAGLRAELSAAAAQRLRAMPIAATYLAGRLTYLTGNGPQARA